jgi:hypothetical protein
MNCLSIFLFSSALWQTELFERPPELDYLQQRRGEIADAVVEWKNAAAHGTFLYTAKVSGADLLSIRHGDESGTRYGSQPGDPYRYSKDYALIKGDRFWSYTDDSGSLHRTRLEEREPTTDVRTFGMHPRLMTKRSPLEIFPEGAVSYTVTDAPGGLREVTAHFDDGVFKWWLDPSKDMAPVRCASIAGGQVTFESRTTYRRHGDTWFPARVEYFRGDKLESTVEVLSASFGVLGTSGLEPGRELGLVPGVHVIDPGEREPKFWDGSQAITGKEYDERLAQGTIDNRLFVERLERIKAGYIPGSIRKKLLLDAQSVPREPGLWEDYTLQFMHEHNMNAEERYDAWRILRDCQDQAYQYLGARRNDFGHIAGLLDKADPAQDSERIQQLKADREKLLVPIGEIFERELKPRLFRIVERRPKPAAQTSQVPAPGQ